MNLYPVELQIVDPPALLIDWSDGQRRIYPLVELRDGCPCAFCRQSSKTVVPEGAIHLPVLSKAETAPLSLVAMTPVGSYAYCLEFSDGHNSGIYTFELLRELGHEAPRDAQDPASGR